MPRPKKVNAPEKTGENKISINKLTEDVLKNNICKRVDFVFSKLSFNTVNMLYYEYKLKNIEVTDKITFSMNFKNSWKGLMHFLLCLGYSEYKEKFEGVLYKNGLTFKQKHYYKPIKYFTNKLSRSLFIYANHEEVVETITIYKNVEKLLTRKSQPPLYLEDFNYSRKNVYKIISGVLKLLNTNLDKTKLYMVNRKEPFEYLNKYEIKNEYNEKALYHILKDCHDDYAFVQATIMEEVLKNKRVLVVHPQIQPHKAIEINYDIDYLSRAYFLAYPIFKGWFSTILSTYFPALKHDIIWCSETSVKHPIIDDVLEYIDPLSGNTYLESNCDYLIVATQGLEHLLNPYCFNQDLMGE